MKKKLSFLVVLTIFSLNTSVFSQKTYTTQYTKVVSIVLADGINPIQKIEGITINLNPLTDSDFEKPIFNPLFNLKFRDYAHSRIIEEKRPLRVDLHYQLSAFFVTITNNTDHILKMKDARLIYIDPDFDEPIIPYDKQSVKDDIKNNFPICEVLAPKIMKVKGGPYTNMDVEMTDLEIENEILNVLTGVVHEVKFINGFNMEIFPGLKTSGYVFFPVEPEDISDGKLSFIDMVSKTDAVGNPTNKVRFDYKTKQKNWYYKVDPNINSWAFINEDEYNKGLITPEKFWWNRKQKQWISGVKPRK